MLRCETLFNEIPIDLKIRIENRANRIEVKP